MIGEEIKRMGGSKFEQTGSSCICDPPVTDSDIDFIVYTANVHWFVENAWRYEGYELGGGSDYDDTDAEFYSLRKGKINLIVTDDEEFYRKFCLATQIAKEWNLTDKADRVLLFEAITHGVLKRWPTKNENSTNSKSPMGLT